MTRLSHHRAQGVTLVELVVSIVVISIAGVALASTLAYLNGAGNTSILQAQAQSIANSYLNEILGKSFSGPYNGGVRALFDDVSDYNGLDTPVASDEFGNVSGNFRVRVSALPGVLNGLPANAVLLVNVTVDYGNASSVVASGYRTNY
jgi:MSHA pilin protein MshD